jgi:hypothetical protein
VHRSVLGALAASLVALLAAAPAAHAAPATCAVGTFVSADAGRGGASALEGRALSGEAYVFADSVAPLDRVTFTLSGPEGVVRAVVETSADWDLGTTGEWGRARPLRTTDLPDGEYTLRTEWAYAGAAVTACAGAERGATTSFTVDNTFSCGVGIVVSASPDRRGGRYLSGETITEDAHVFIDTPPRPGQELSPSTAVVDSVALELYRISGNREEQLVSTVERHPAFDLLGTRADGSPRPLRPGLLGPGTYVVTASWTYVDESIFGCGDTNHGTTATFVIPEEA